MTTVTHVRHVGLVSPAPREAAEFYERLWRLGKVAERDGATYFRGKVSEPFILAIYPGERRAIHHIAMGLPNRQAVDEKFELVSRKGLPIVHPPQALDQPGGGYGFRFVDVDGRCIELSAEVAGADLATDRGIPEGGPLKIGHVVLNTPDLDRSVDFYQEVFGFTVSDWSEHQMAFLRCNTDHHSIAMNAGPHASLNHVAYDVAEIHDLMRGVGRLRKGGVATIWGPGRHGPGGYMFCYFVDPSGFVCEYETGGVKIVKDADHQPRVWKRAPELLDTWGTSGPQPPELRSAMAGEPDPGVFAPAGAR